MRSITLTAFLFLSFLSSAQVAEKAEDVSPLLIGENIPVTAVLSLENEKTSTAAIFKAKPTVLLFYRGGWCPYCNAHLSAVGEITEEIEKMGYQIVAVSPDSPEKLKESAREQNLDYQLVSDAAGDLATTMGIAFRSPEKYASLLSNRSNSENPGFLPVPSLFVVDQKDTILFEYISPDYKQRISSNMLLGVLEALQEKL